MRDALVRDLAVSIDPAVVDDLLTAYEALLTRQRAGDADGALIKGGLFVEHLFRALEYIRTGTAPKEIKSPAATARLLEPDTSLPEALRILVPRIALAMIYDVRSKRGAAHVKEISPRQIDATLQVSAASWILAELIRLFHVSPERSVERIMQSLTRTTLPLIENVGGDVIVTSRVSADVEILLLLADAMPNGFTRREIGLRAKCSPPSVTRVLQKLQEVRFVHLGADGRMRLTGTGEAHLSEWLASNGRFAA